MTPEQRDELDELCDSIETALNEAISFTREFERKARKAGDKVLAGAIEGYLLSSLREWVESEDQPGALPDLRTRLHPEDADDESDDE